MTRTSVPRAALIRRCAVGFLGASLGMTALASSASTASAANPVPGAVPGDPHSPRVVHLATTALDALHRSENTGNPIVQFQFDDARNAVAAAAADEVGLSEAAMQQAWARADIEHQTALLAALTQLGVEYQTNTSEPGVGFDCSGLTTFAWAQAGVEIPRQSGSQIDEATTRDAATAEAGDLVEYPGHVMMYLGVADAVVHSSNPENDVELWVLSEDRAASVRYGDPMG